MEQLAALSMGYPGSVLATAGIGNWNMSWFKALAQQGVQVFDLAFNNDPEKLMPDGSFGSPGRIAQKELAKELVEVGLRFTDASPKELGDINDALLRKRDNL